MKNVHYEKKLHILKFCCTKISLPFHCVFCEVSEGLACEFVSLDIKEGTCQLKLAPAEHSESPWRVSAGLGLNVCAWGGGALQLRGMLWGLHAW